MDQLTLLLLFIGVGTLISVALGIGSLVLASRKHNQPE